MRLAHRTIADGIDQMGFAQADAPINKQRVVVKTRFVGNRKAGGVSKLIACANNEIIEGISDRKIMVALRRRKYFLPLFSHGNFLRWSSRYRRLLVQVKGNRH